MPVVYAAGVTANRYAVYRLINPFNKRAFYIGYSSNAHRRLKDHLNKEPGTNEGKLRWQLISKIRANKGLIRLEVIRTFTYRGKAMKYESALIKQHLEDGEKILNSNKLGCNSSLSFHLFEIDRIVSSTS